MVLERQERDAFLGVKHAFTEKEFLKRLLTRDNALTDF